MEKKKSRPRPRRPDPGRGPGAGDKSTLNMAVTLLEDKSSDDDTYISAAEDLSEDENEASDDDTSADEDVSEDEDEEEGDRVEAVLDDQSIIRQADDQDLDEGLVDVMDGMLMDGMLMDGMLMDGMLTDDEREGGDDAHEIEFDLGVLGSIWVGSASEEESCTSQIGLTCRDMYDDMEEITLENRILAGKMIELPPGCKHTANDLYEEVELPPPDPVPESVGENLVPITELDEISQRAFKGMKSLNRIQSVVFETAYNTKENLLICAPTGAGKTNIAMLTILQEVKKHIHQGVIKKDEFKVTM